MPEERRNLTLDECVRTGNFSNFKSIIQFWL